jgi:hypothetical protein
MVTDSLRKALLDSGHVADCAIVSRTTTSGTEEPVAYFVPANNASPARAKRLLRLELESRGLGCSLAAVQTLPLTADGRVDEGALQRVEICNPISFDEWSAMFAERIGARCELEEVDSIAATPRIHVSDLALAPPSVGNASDSRAAPIRPAGADSESVLGRPAISIGPPLPEAVDAPRNLGEALTRTAATFGENTLTYLYDDGAEHVETYVQLLRRARRILGGLRATGVRPGDIVILQLADHRH